MIRGNGWGIAMIVIGGLSGGMSNYFFKFTDHQALIILGVTWVILDVALRARRRYQSRWLFSRQAGGFIWYIPVWAFGLVILVINTILAFTA